MRHPDEIEKIYEASDGESDIGLLGPMDIQVPEDGDY